MKLQSFAVQSKSKPSKKITFESPSTQSQPQNDAEFVSEFDPSQTLISAKKKTTIIPPKENEWRPHKKMKNIELPPLQSGNKPLDFELEDSDFEVSKDAGNSMLYGLNVRQRDGNGNGDVKGGGNSIDSIMLRQFKNDLETLPEEQGFDEYEDTPIEGFGAALLAGYGWQKGKGIGKNVKDDVKPVEYKRRTAKEGLGFMADHPPPVPKVPGNSDREKVNRGRSDGKDGVFGVGQVVRIVRGSKMGLKGTIVEVFKGSMVVLDNGSGKKESYRLDEVAELGSVEEEKCLNKLKELKIRDMEDDRKQSKKDDMECDRTSHKNDKSVKRDDSYKNHKSVKREDSHKNDKSVKREDSKRSRECSAEKIKVERERKEEKSGKDKQPTWLRNHIRVRIISKKFGGGRFYLKKGEVMDVIGPGICDIAMDEGREIIREVKQDFLETALPKRGGPILVLSGKHKGVYGKLVEKNSEEETGVVQDADTLEMFNVRLEQIAEYLGDPSDLGY